METIDPVDEVLPARKLVPLGLQHVLVMYAGAVAVPLIIGRALELDAAQIAFLINADLFACGLATLFQATGFLGLGIRMPVMMGVTFASVGPMLAMIAAGKVSGLSKEDTLNLIYGSVIAAGAPPPGGCSPSVRVSTASAVDASTEVHTAAESDPGTAPAT